MLRLIHTDRHEVGLVQQNIRRHQRGVGEQTCIDVVRMLGALVLELRHARQLAEHGIAVEHPGKLGMRGHMRLYIKRILLRIETASHVECQRLIGVTAQIGRNLPHGDGMHVCHAVKALVLVRKRIKIAQCAEVVSDGEVARGLHTGKDHFFCIQHEKRFPFVLHQALCMSIYSLAQSPRISTPRTISSSEGVE